MASNPLLTIRKFGQSIWLDLLSRELLVSGRLRRMRDEDGLRGVTSNPAIFQKAISGSDDYENDIRELLDGDFSAAQVYRAVTVSDIRAAADLFRSVYDGSAGQDGFVSLEVSPHLAYDTEGTIEEARQLWSAAGRPNVMIKVPGTRPGLEAIRQLTREGLNVNVTLLFGIQRYREVAEAYIAGLEQRVAAGERVDGIASVASFFLSRIDVMVDPMLKDAPGGDTQAASQLMGEVAIASAKVAYQAYKGIFSGPRFERLTGLGAHSQRLLWGSTGTKDPAYSDVKYVEALIGPETVNTLPLETLEAYRDHGQPAPRLEEDLVRAHDVLTRLAQFGIDLDKVTESLEREGVRKFIEPYDKTFRAIEQKRQAVTRTLGGWSG